jgi:hypothetical protein
MFSNRIRSDASKNTGIVRFGSTAEVHKRITRMAASETNPAIDDGRISDLNFGRLLSSIATAQIIEISMKRQAGNGRGCVKREFCKSWW